MPAFIASLFGGLVAWFAEFLTKKVAIRMAAIVAFTAATVTFATAIKALVAAIAYSPAGDVLCKMGWCIPSNTAACIGALTSAFIARWLYDQAVARIKFMAM